MIFPALRWAVVLLGVGAAPVACRSEQRGAELEKKDLIVTTRDGLDIFVRRVYRRDGEANRGPFLLVNGGRPGVLASWDSSVTEPSVADVLARAGHVVYLMDVRGFGRSEFPKEMSLDRFKAPIAVRSYEAVRDIEAVTSEIRRRHPRDRRLAALGWATGSQWLGHFASLHPKVISHLVYYQGAYGGAGEPWPFQDIAEPGKPTELNFGEYGSYRCATEASLVRGLREAGAPELLLERYAQLAFEGDSRASKRNPPCFNVPSGPLADTLMMVNDRRIFDASFITGEVLIVRSEKDFWSRATDVETLQEHLTNARSVDAFELKGASHYAHLIPGESRTTFLDVVLGFTDTHKKSDEPRTRRGQASNQP